MAVSGLQTESAFTHSQFEIENQGLTSPEIDHDDNNSIISDQSNDLGERERVRQIFQEWTNTGAKSHSNYQFHLKNNSGPQWLGENECERVRIIREWVQMNTKQVNNQGSLRNGVDEVGNRIEQVRDGLEVSYADTGARRPFRKLCGRQTLLDLLLRAQSERKMELHGLLEKRRVSEFAYRNRIQALLKGRFLRNERLIPDARPSSRAATELGLLRQRLTVSDLREGFLSKLDNSAPNSVNNDESASSSGDENIDESDSSSTDENNDENSGAHIISDSENILDKDRSPQEVVAQAIEAVDPISDNDENENIDESNSSSSDENNDENGGSHIISDSESILDKDRSPQEVVAQAIEAADPVSDNDKNEQDILFEENIHVPITNESVYVDELDSHTNELARDMNEESNWQENNASGQVDEFQDSPIEIGDGPWEQLNSVLFTEWANDEEQVLMQESHEDWPSQDLQEAIDSWLDMPLGEVGPSVGRLDMFYFPDEDDNVHTMELRELSSRRRVSSLLRSGFRESLDQVLRTLVERQDHGTGELDPQGNTHSSGALVDEEQEQIGGDHVLALYNEAERNPFTPSSALVAGSHPLWNEEFQGLNWPLNNSNLQLGKEWEVINGLRIEMVRLNQRMNDMQSMLETCIDMQIELQRSVRQEVSAALNRSNLSGDASEENKLNDESQWDDIRKGICCLCRDSKIDSLLYRCGHMCTCSKCAENLVQSLGKCPMCRAPAIEVVRGYFIQ